MRKWILGVMGFLFFLSIVPTVTAEENKIDSIHLSINLHEDGSATIRETRNMETYEHTELYITLDNLGDTELLDFHVEGYMEEADWNIEDSFEEKAGKYGVIETDDGYELAWGITEYGTPEYHVEYTLSNLVRNLEDGQALFWNFDSFLSLPTDRLTLEMSAPFSFEEYVLDYYGFGFEGPMNIEDGVLNWTGFGLDESNDVIILAQFPEGTFQANSSMDMTLAEQRDQATEGSSYNEEPPMPLWGKILIAGVAGLGGLAGVAGVTVAVKSHQVKKENNHFFPDAYRKENRNKISQNPPHLEADIGRYSFLISQSVLGAGDFSNYFFAYLLLWSLEDRISIETRKLKSSWFGPDVEADIFIQNFNEEWIINQLSFEEYIALFELGESTLEEVFWIMLLESADANGKVIGDDIQEWSTDHAPEIAEFVELMHDVSEKWLVENDYLKTYKKKSFNFDVEIKELTEKGDTFVSDVNKFYNFIKEITEVNLQDFEEWHELIVWAALFGEAEETIEQLEEFHPEHWAYLINHYPYVYGNYYGYHYFYMSNSTGLSSGGYGGSAGGGMSSGGGGAGAGGGGGGGSR